MPKQKCERFDIQLKAYKTKKKRFRTAKKRRKLSERYDIQLKAFKTQINGSKQKENVRN